MTQTCNSTIYYLHTFSSLTVVKGVCAWYNEMFINFGRLYKVITIPKKTPKGADLYKIDLY